jgi:hypothetical protein
LRGVGEEICPSLFSGNGLVPKSVTGRVLGLSVKGISNGIGMDRLDEDSRTHLGCKPTQSNINSNPLDSETYESYKGVSSNQKIFNLTPNGLRLGWDRLCLKAGVIDLHFHDLRHEAISRFFEMGLTVPEVASISGHRDLRMLMRYAHADHSHIHSRLEANR